MKITKEIEEFINLTITEHMGKEYADRDQGEGASLSTQITAAG